MNPSDGKAIADKILEDFVDTCNDLNIKYALVLGTCLGFYRDGGYILFDNDIDIWVDCGTIGNGYHTEGECYTTLTKRLLELGFTSEHFYHFYRDDILIDMWTRNRPPIGQHHRFTPAGVALLLDTVDTIVYNNKVYNVPHPVEEYLERFYGEDWGIPNNASLR